MSAVRIWQATLFHCDDAEGIIPWVAREGKMVLANDVKKDKRYRPSPLPPEDTAFRIVRAAYL